MSVDKDNPQTSGNAARAAKPATAPSVYSESGLRALEKGNHGPSRTTIERLIYSVRQARAESEEQGWKAADLQAAIDAKETTSFRVLAVVECDGFTNYYADAGVSIRVITVRPFEDSHEMMLSEKSHWSNIWAPGYVRKTSLPEFVTTPNKFAPNEILDVLAWEKNVRTFECLKKVEAMLRERT